VRALALLSVLVAAGTVLALSASALGQVDEPVDTVPTETVPVPDQQQSDQEQFGKQFDDQQKKPAPAKPRSQTRDKGDAAPAAPPAPVTQPAPVAQPATLPRTGRDEPVLVATAFWLLLGGITLRRVCSIAESPRSRAPSRAR
jgi:hypothetical protein